MEGYLGEIRMVAFDFEPQGWAFCNGQHLSVHENTALYSLIKDTYGGNGETSFALPDLRARAPIHFNYDSHHPIRPIGQKIDNNYESTKSDNDSNDQITEPSSLNYDDSISQSIAVNFIICIDGLYPARK